MDPMVESSWKLKGYSAPAKEYILLVEKSMGHAKNHLKGIHTPSSQGGTNEVGSPTTTFWQKATKGPSLANLDGALHETHLLCTYLLVVCGGYAGRGCSELLGECIPIGCSSRTQANVRTWAQFRDAIVQRFELVTEVEEASKQL